MVATSRRRTVALVLALLVGLLVGITTVVPPRGSTAVAAVSRFGDGVRLLPHGLALSSLALERRVLLPRVDGSAVVDAGLEVALPGGAGSRVPVRLHLGGAGPLPIVASRVRAEGWDAAWSERLAGVVSLTPAELQALVRSTALWARMLPGDGRDGAGLDLAPHLAPRLAPLELRRVEIREGLDDGLVRAVARQEVASRTHPGGRLVLLGLDALDWQLVDELVARGVMPNLGRLMRRGVHAVLDVPPPLISPVVWTTIGTGVPPERHGVLDFLEPDPAGGPPHPVSSASRRVPAIWEMAAAAGRSTAVIGWWASFPAQAPAGGAVYSDRLTEQLLGLSARMPALADPPQAEAAARQLAVKATDVTAAMLAPLVPVSQAELDAVVGRNDAWDDPVGGLAKLMAASVTVARLTAHELGRGTDVVLAYLEGTDTVGHLFGPYRPPILPGFDPAIGRRFGGVVDTYYAWVDRWIGEVVAQLGDGDTLAIVSDHGFHWKEGRPRVPAGAHTATAVQWHRPEGAFLAVGPRVRASVARQRLGILDVAPCLLALAGVPAAAEMPGRVPDWLLVGGGGPGSPVRYEALLPPRDPVSVELPPEAREEELAKLRALGYLAGADSAPQPTGTGQPQSTRPPAAPPPAAMAVPTPAFDRAEARRLNNLAISQASAGDKTAAERTFHQAIAADRTYASPYYSLSVLLRKQGRLEEADGAFWMAVRLGVAERELAVVRLALDYRERGLPDTAREVFARGREMFPESATIWLNSGVFLGEQGDLAGARECLERAVQLDPANANGHRNLALAQLALGDREGARRSLARALELDPSDPATRQQLEELGGPPAAP